MPRRRGGKAEAAPRLGAAQEFLDAAVEDGAHGRWRATVSNAALAGIAAANVIGYANLGERGDKRHAEALDVLADAKMPLSIRDDLQFLLDHKSESQCADSMVGGRDTARDAVLRARRLVERAIAEFAEADRCGWKPTATPAARLAATTSAATRIPNPPAATRRWQCPIREQTGPHKGKQCGQILTPGQTCPHHGWTAPT
jgi:hypothetical protein